MSKRKSPAPAKRQPSGEIRLSEHPRAQFEIRRAKSWGGLVGCGLAGYIEWQAGLPFVEVATHALIWGIVAYLLVWFLAVQVWRQLVVAEVRAAERQWQERKAELERVARERAAMAGQG